MEAARHRYEFGGFTLDRRNWTLLGPDGAAVALTPKAFDALVFFLDRPGQVIDRETLVDTLWPDTIVEENNLNQVVAALRRALGDGFIQTVPRRGYQFVARVSVVDAGNGASSPVPRAVSHRRPIAIGSLVIAALAAVWFGTRVRLDSEAGDSPMLIVLPFVDASEAGDLEQLSDGFVVELLTTLSLIDGLDVQGSVTSFYFKDHPADVATLRDLGADYALEGDLRSADDRLRISVRLTETGGGTQIWSDSYDRVKTDVFALQEDIARATAQALQITLGVGELGTRLGGTRNPEAFFAIVESHRIIGAGNRFLPADVRRGLPQLERAVTLDENCALCWYELYAQNSWLSVLANDSGGSDPRALARARFALARVEELTPNLPELVIARLESDSDANDIARALERLLREAGDLRYPPAILSLLEARYLRFTGRIRESVDAAWRARTYDPLNPAIVSVIADGYSFEGRHREALDLLDEFARTGEPTAGLRGAAFVIAMQSGNRDEVIERAAAMRPSRNDIVTNLVRNIEDPARVLALLREFVASPDPGFILWPTMLSPWAAYFGDDELALEMYRHEVPFATGNSVSRPILSGMRRLDGFKDIVRDKGLLSYWRESGNWPDYCRPLDGDEFECF